MVCELVAKALERDSQSGLSTANPLSVWLFQKACALYNGIAFYEIFFPWY